MKALPPLGRLLFSALFISSGLNHFLQFDSMTGYARASGVPIPGLAVAVSGIILLLGGLSVLLGLFTRVGALLLGLFLVVTAFVMHDFWNFPAAEAAAQQPHFFKNLALAGGSLLLMYFGPGPVSVDEAMRKRGKGMGGVAARGGYREERLEPQHGH